MSRSPHSGRVDLQSKKEPVVLKLTGENRSRARAARILDRIREIPEGLVRSYGDIEPGAPRLVGRILATTTEEVPWHRVVRSDGTIPMGQRQIERLRAEGVPIRGNRVDLRSLRWV
jgi:methylated-DNA-protein-cysteine methyltransferase related protein